MTHLHTFLFTDLENSTSLWEQYPDEMRPALARHDAILKDAVEGNNGEIVKSTGDGILASFDNPSDGINAAIACQRGMRAETWPKQFANLAIRIGLHLGDAEHRDGDLFGSDVNRAARIMGAAHGNQIVVSGILMDAADEIPEEVTFKDMGMHRLKGLTQLTHFYQVNVPGLPDEFPRLNTLDVSPNNLPVQLNKFIGREKELAEIRDALSVSRLVTLTGSGGAGKTRLSLEVAEALQDGHPHGVWFVELAPQTDPDLIPQTIATVLEIADDEERDLESQIKDFCKKKKLLLILDNCEHLIEACARISNRLLRACPNLRILASSREALGVPGEVPYRVPSLKTPAPETLNNLAEFEAIEAVQLFTERAKTALTSFALTPQNAPTVARICQRLDGIPLAIELAAARVRVMTVEQISERLDDRFRLLTGGSRTALPRQQTLRALIDWSYSLLNEQEKILLRRLSAFTGGWDLDAAEAICADENIDTYEILDLLTSLVDKSLVVTEETTIGTRYHLRYRRLETIRQYAREKFFETDEVAMVRENHLAYFVKMAETAEVEFNKSNVVEWLMRIEHNFENIFSAISWATETNVTSGLRIVNALFDIWQHKGHLREASSRLALLMEQMDEQVPPEVRAKAYFAGSIYSFFTGDYQKKIEYLETSLALYESISDLDGIMQVKQFIGYMQFNEEGDFAKSEQTFLDCLAYYEKTGNKNKQADIYSWMAGSVYSTIDLPLSLEYLEKSLVLYQEEGNIFRPRGALGLLVRLTMFAGDFSKAKEYARQHRELSQKLSIKLDSGILVNEARVYFYEGEFETAKKMLLEAREVDELSGTQVWLFWPVIMLAATELQIGNLDATYGYFLEGFELLKIFDSLIAPIYFLEVFANFAVEREQFEPAARLLAFAEARRIDISDHRPPVEQNGVDTLVQKIQDALDAQTFEKANAAGEKMGYDEALAYALENIKP
jgi:predicted ATPase/class 3 adenylate cyclase